MTPCTQPQSQNCPLNNDCLHHLANNHGQAFTVHQNQNQKWSGVCDQRLRAWESFSIKHSAMHPLLPPCDGLYFPSVTSEVIVLKINLQITYFGNILIMIFCQHTIFSSTKISDVIFSMKISLIYIVDIYRANPGRTTILWKTTVRKLTNVTLSNFCTSFHWYQKWNLSLNKQYSQCYVMIGRIMFGVYTIFSMQGLSWSLARLDLSRLHCIPAVLQLL